MTTMPPTPDPVDPVEQACELAVRSTPDRFLWSLTGGKFKRPRHVRWMGDVLSRVLDGNQRIILTVSVRHGKSWMGSYALPIWYLDQRPHHSIGFATYQANFSALWGRRVRNAIVRHQDRLNVSLAYDSTAAHSWETTAGGGMHTAGVGGEFTGRGFNLFVIDDPVKNAEEANSEVFRDKAWEWWQGTIYTRLEPGASVVIIMARWHEDDLVGRLERDMAEGGERWEIIRLPALAEDHDPLGRRPGEALWPERYSEPALQRIRRAVGSRTWNALYQQRPSPEEGGHFKRQWFRYHRDAGEHYELQQPDGTVKRVLKRQCRRFATADTAMREKTTADYTVIGVWDQTPEHDLILVDLERAQMDIPDAESELRKVFPRWGVQFLGLEDAASGIGIAQRMVRHGLPVKMLKPGNSDKVARSTTASVLCENGKLYFPAGARWLADYEHELLTFPNGTYDDQVDMTSWAAICATNQHIWAPVVAEFDPRPAEHGGHVESMPRLPSLWPSWVYISYGNYTAALLLAVDPEEMFHAADEVYGFNLSVPETAQRVREMLQRHGLSLEHLQGVVIDPGDDAVSRSNLVNLSEQFARQGMTVYGWTPANHEGLQAMTEGLRMRVREGRVRVDQRCANTISELQTWRHKVMQDGSVDPNEKHEGPCHAIRCLRAWLASDPTFGHDDDLEIIDTATF